MASNRELQNVQAARGVLQEGEVAGFSGASARAAGIEQLIQLVSSNAPILLFLVDRGGIIRLSTGKPMDQLSSVLPVDMLGRSIYDIYRDTPQIIHDFERAFSGEAFSQEIKIGPLVFDTRYSPYRDERGEILGVVGVATDITGKRRAEEALAQSEALFSALFERAGIGIVLKDAKGMMIRFNPSFRSMLGYSTEELQKFHYNDITHPLDQPISDRLFKELAAGQRDSYSLEKRYRHKDGSYVWARMTATPIMDPEGRTQFIIGMVEDITTRKLIEMELAEVRSRLTRSRENERLRIAQELHDGPLQEIIGLSFQAQTLEGLVHDPGDEELVRSMQQALDDLATRLRAIAQELRPPALAPFGLEKAIESHALAFQKQHPELAIRLKLGQDGQTLEEDMRFALFRIYQESLNNILKHSQAANVWVRFFVDDERAVLEIQDDGKGFEVPDRWVVLARDGHMGLIGSRERAEAVGGRLDVESAPGKGTLIRAIVPHNGYGEL